MSVPTDQQHMEKIVNLCKRRGFIFQASESYGGPNGASDYGTLGVEVKRNLKNYWWRVTVHEREDVVGMDGAILTPPDVLKASGHVEGFSDPMIDCRSCKAHLRLDQLIDKKGVKQCPNCGSKDLTEARQFNLMFETHVGAAADESSIAYLRPETAQSIFVQFKNILEVSRKKLPFGIAQIGKAFRNEINPRNFTFRSREFEQMELEYFCRAEEGMKLLEYWKEERLKFYENIGIPRSKLHVLTVPDEERAFYSKGTYDIEYDFPLLKNNEQLVTKAKEIVDLLRPHMFAFYDESGAIGRRYRRQDEIGTPFGITVDFETLGEKDSALRETVTLRERDSMKQERVAIKDLPAIFHERLA